MQAIYNKHTVMFKIMCVGQILTLWVQQVLQQKTKALLYLSMYMFTKLLLHWYKCYLQYMHMWVILLIYKYMLNSNLGLTELG